MYYKTRVEIPQNTGKITFKKIKNTVYVNYEYDRVYIPEKQYTLVKRTTVGKVCAEDESKMYINSNFVKYFPDAEYPQEKSREERSCCLRVGAWIGIKKIIRDYKLDAMMERIIGKDSGLFLDLAAYAIICENNAGQYYPDYAYNHPLFTEKMRLYSDSKVSEFINSMTRNQSIGFLNEWNAQRDHREKIYISYDSTNKYCQAGDVDIAELGHSKDGKDIPVINYSIAYDKNNKEPLFYEEYPGSVVDVSQLQYMLEKAKSYGYRKAGFILDRGYFSSENIHFMDRNHYDFVIMVKGMKSLVRNLVMENRNTFEDVRSCHIAQFDVNGITIKRKLFETDEQDRYFHIYYSNQKHCSERAELEHRIEKQKQMLKRLQGNYGIVDKSYETYFDLIYQENQFLLAKEKEQVVEREIRLCGYFCIITSEQMSAKDAIMLYKSRDASEKIFRGDKTYLGNRSLRMQSTESVGTKVFIEFVALIIRNRIYNLLKEAMVNDDKKANYMTVPAALKELEKIEMVRIMDGIYRPDHAVTSTQKTILKALGIDNLYLKQELKNITEALSKEN